MSWQPEREREKEKERFQGQDTLFKHAPVTYFLQSPHLIIAHSVMNLSMD
jgi:hypothetical protein